MSQTVTEVERHDHDIREFLVISDEAMQFIDIGMFSAVPSVNSPHPTDDNLFVYNVNIEMITGKQHKIAVHYRPMFDIPISNGLDKGVKPEDAYTMPPLPRKEVISVQPGDVIVVSTPHDLTKEERAVIGANLTVRFPSVDSVVLGGGMTLEVYREQEKGECVTSIISVDEVVIRCIDRRKFIVNCCKNTTAKQILRHQDIPKLNDKHAFNSTVVSNVDVWSSLVHGNKATNEVIVTYKEPEANPYTEAKNTCTDCDKGPCDRTLHNPCDDEVTSDAVIPTGNPHLTM